MSRYLRIDYGSSVLSLPKERLLTAIPEASGFDLKVLILIAANEALRGDYDACCNELCSQLDCTKSALERSLAFWYGVGLLSSDGTADSAEKKPTVQNDSKPTPAANTVTADTGTKAEAAKQTKQLMSSQLPEYSESVCADIMAKAPELSEVINMCQQISGKIFTPADVAVVIGLYDNLGLSGEYIVSLFNYCCNEKGKKSARYIEKVAIDFFDKGIDTLDTFSAYIKKQEELKEALPEIRKLLEIGERDLTAKEKTTIDCWLGEWNYGMDIIRRAWETTIDNIKKPSISYMNKVLDNWHKSGFSTLEEIEAYLQSYQKSKQDPAHSTQTVNGTESGFQTDEFFEAALRRSYKE